MNELDQQPKITNNPNVNASLTRAALLLIDWMLEEAAKIPKSDDKSLPQDTEEKQEDK